MKYTLGQRVEVLSAHPTEDSPISPETWYPGTVKAVGAFAVYVLRDDGVFGTTAWLPQDVRPLRGGTVPATTQCLVRFDANGTGQINSDPGLVGLVDAWIQLGPNARKLLEYTAKRLLIGKAHGDFDQMGRDWEKETAEEEFDAAMYRAAKHLGMGK